MARKVLSLLIVAAIIYVTLFLLKECDSNGGGLSPLSKVPGNIWQSKI